MRNIRLYIYIAFMVVLLSCSKEPLLQDGSGDCVSFYVNDKNFADEGTKAIVEDTETLFSLGLSLRVCDLAGINSGATGNNLIKDKEVKYNQDYKLWRSDLTWNTSRSYEFYGYILSPHRQIQATCHLRIAVKSFRLDGQGSCRYIRLQHDLHIVGLRHVQIIDTATQKSDCRQDHIYVFIKHLHTQSYLGRKVPSI